MQISKVSLIVSVAGALTVQVFAQSASSELQNKALELLRQTMAQQEAATSGVKAQPAPAVPSQPAPAVRAQPAPAVAAPAVAAQPAPTVSAAPAPSGGPVSLTPEQQQRAMELLREKTARDQGSFQTQPVTKAPTVQAMPGKATATVPAAKATTATKAAPAGKATATKATSTKTQGTAKSSSKSVKSGKTAAKETVAAPTVPVPDQPTGPKTKQQRLSDLLEEYKADKITPSEYHAQRAKILAEP